MAKSAARPVARKSPAHAGATRPQTRTAGKQQAKASSRKASAIAPVVPVRISTDFTNAFVKSPADAERVTVDLLNADRPGKDRLADSGELLHFV